jgi:hypothetical protein
MTELRHEARVRGRNGAIVFVAGSQDGRLVIRQEPEDRRAKDVCSITLTFFAPLTGDEEQEIRRRHEAGESIPTIARARKRSPRADENRGAG